MTSPREAEEELREIVRELSGELDSVQAQLAVKQREASAVEALAMSAIKRGDDLAARDALVGQMDVFAEMAELDADAKVLQSLLDEIHEFLTEHSATGTR